MARRKSTVTIGEEGRDKGKVFVLTELPADQAERWAIRALLAIANAGGTLPDGALDSGMAGMAAAGLEALARVPYAAVAPLLDEMWGCVQYQHAPNIPLQTIIDGEGSQIEEVSTRILLRKAVLQLHTGFFSAEATLILARPPSAKPPA